jgi:predicted kinase
MLVFANARYLWRAAGNWENDDCSQVGWRDRRDILRIDSIEQAIRDCDPAQSHNEAGYRIAYAIAEDNLRIGRTVVADSVNPLEITREAWREVGRRVQVRTVEIEVICSDPEEHHRRVVQRTGDFTGLKLPTWQEVVEREYQPWHREHILVDTATQRVEESVRWLQRILQQKRSFLSTE